jgi:hypothetical protein
MSAFVDDFFAAVPSSLSWSCFDKFRWFVQDLLGLHLKTEKDKDPAPSGILLGIEVTLRPGGNGSFRLPEDKRSRYLAKVQHVLDVDCLAPGKAAKLAGCLSFASSVTLGRFGRPFLQPIYGLAAGRSVDEIHPLSPAEAVVMGPADKGLPRRLRMALLWWVEILSSFPDKDFAWGSAHKRPVKDVFTDASAENRWEGLGGVVYHGSSQSAWTYRLDTVPAELEVFLPSKDMQKVRIAQLEMLAVLIFVRLFGLRLQGSYVRFHIDNLSAMYCLINGYSSNPFMARISGEVWMLLLSHNICPWFQYVPSKLNVADIFSRPDKKVEGRRLAHGRQWRSFSVGPIIAPLVTRLQQRPSVVWGELQSRLYDGRRP